MFDNILFDLDGTLSDPFNGISNAVTYAMRKLDLPDPDISVLKAFIGPPIYYSFDKMCGGDKVKSDKAVAYYREYYTEKGKYENTVYDGVIPMLQRLRSSGKKLAVATSKPESFSVDILRHFGIAEYFDFIAAASLDKSRSEKDQVIAYALSSLNISNTARSVMVGDRKYDIIGAKNNGLKSIGVLYGYGSKDELTEAGADHIADSPKTVADLILNDIK